ncbi:hypothetical protein RHMOL_Rhmol04G0298600 [Rhododendron molle]|uniref:Uncharacterized protein n=1 Tax=Rhododendron molle TaxID=49168 RepID=A0ACC0P722_RHOML|nr:hypothetical protein RHMOL_Rhmol04G0298600 [Rhododendron molle]
MPNNYQVHIKLSRSRSSTLSIACRKEIGTVLRSQFWVHTRVSTINGESELQNRSSTRPPVLKADSEAMVDTGIANTSRATWDKIGYLLELFFYHKCKDPNNFNF